MRSWRRRSSLLALVALAAGVARAQTLVEDINSFQADADQYNVIGLNSVTLEGSSDAGGAFAVGTGGLTVDGSWTIASNKGASGSNPSLYDAGGLTLNNTGVTLNTPSAYLPGLQSSQWTWDSPNKLVSNSNSSDYVQINGSGQSNNPITTGTAPTGWSSMATNFTTLSTDFNNATATGTISVVDGALTFSAPNGVTNGVVVFDLDAADLTATDYNGVAYDNLNLDAPAGVNYVINVTGITGSSYSLFSSSAFNTGDTTAAEGEQTLWNFEGCSDVDITVGSGTSTTFYGSILAPEATITTDDVITGQVVADNVVADGLQLEDTDPFTSVNLPEAGTFAWWALGLCGLGIALHRRRSWGRA